MDRAYEDDETRALAEKQGFVPVVPPKRNRKEPWDYDKELYKRRNEIERYFLRIKRFRKVFTRYDKLDIIYSSVIYLAMIFDAILMLTHSRVYSTLFLFSIRPLIWQLQMNLKKYRAVGNLTSTARYFYFII